MVKLKKHRGTSRPILFTFLGFMALGVFIAWLIRGTDVFLFSPKGHIAHEELKLMLLSFAILLGIGVPTLTVLYFVAWKYRESNMDAKRDLRATRGKLFMFTVWAIPCSVMVLLSIIMWSETHRLEPRKALAADTPTLQVQVIALRWKWLFIYPEQQIATVNFAQIPTNTPVRFELTADEAPMSAFWVPHLAGMLYAMTGHVNPLNLSASEAGDFPGRTAEINGPGFAGMQFTTRASSPAEFDRWVASVRQSGSTLDAASYQELLQPSEDNQVAYYAHADNDLYAKVVMKYMGAHGGHASGAETSHEGHE